MSRPDCISNRNARIIATYVRNRIGSYQSLFDGLSYPRDEYLSAHDFFMNEDEWTTYDNFERIFRKGKELVGEPEFFFNCGASCKIPLMGTIPLLCKGFCFARRWISQAAVL